MHENEIIKGLEEFLEQCVAEDNSLLKKSQKFGQLPLTQQTSMREQGF